MTYDYTCSLLNIGKLSIIIDYWLNWRRRRRRRKKKQEFHQLTGLFINLSPIYRRSIKCWLDFDGPSSKLINFKWVMLSLISIIKTAQGHWQSPFDQLFRRVLQSFCGNFVQLFKVLQISTAFQVFFHKLSKNYLIFRIF